MTFCSLLGLPDFRWTVLRAQAELEALVWRVGKLLRYNFYFSNFHTLLTWIFVRSRWIFGVKSRKLWKFEHLEMSSMNLTSEMFVTLQGHCELWKSEIECWHGLWVDLAWVKAVTLAKMFHEINSNTQHCIATTWLEIHLWVRVFGRDRGRGNQDFLRFNSKDPPGSYENPRQQSTKI